MKFLNCNRVLCLSPHPDDVEYGMAGTIFFAKIPPLTCYVLHVGVVLTKVQIIPDWMKSEVSG